MPTFVSYIEFSGTGRTSDVVDRLIDHLDGFDPSISEPASDRIGVRVNIDGPDLGVATRTVVALATNALATLVPDAKPVHVETSTEREFEVREALTDGHTMLTVADAMRFLGVSRQAVLQQIESGRLAGAQRSRDGDAYLIPADSIRDRARQRVVLGWAPSWDENGIEIGDDTQRRAILEPMYDALSIVGALPAYREAQKAEQGEEHNGLLARTWRDAERDALDAMAMLGMPTTGVRFFAEPLATRGTTGF
ncbi:helix-turn-helix domain-containing protein [Homoserinibacter sp. GY 40078]|uniref:helix-turn-helix domain-containing protein n=1 Tax=Homoserinibacter sp. GY 40078 TaxID=2603275 RepID=UPI0011CC3555|nr:helix-turn-helix domain-containing protein [Homoserinibacter sp. GY 40078]TXK17419.1 helix-turn-helix domain-containing protein [Homoserinibacter sp. GY 40078]